MPLRAGHALDAAGRDDEQVPDFEQNIAKHLKAIFAEGELLQEAVVNHRLTTAADGQRYCVGHQTGR
ncbi:hypothetical protein [Immundisolibacter sp.]